MESAAEELERTRRRKLVLQQELRDLEEIERRQALATNTFPPLTAPDPPTHNPYFGAQTQAPAPSHGASSHGAPPSSATPNRTASFGPPTPWDNQPPPHLSPPRAPNSHSSFPPAPFASSSKLTPQQAETQQLAALPSRNQVDQWLRQKVGLEGGLDTPFNIEGREIDLYVLFGAVMNIGGSDAMSTRQQWTNTSSMAGPSHPTAAPPRMTPEGGRQLRSLFMRYLRELEIVWDRTNPNLPQAQRWEDVRPRSVETHPVHSAQIQTSGNPSSFAASGRSSLPQTQLLQPPSNRPGPAIPATKPSHFSFGQSVLPQRNLPPPGPRIQASLPAPPASGAPRLSFGQVVVPARPAAPVLQHPAPRYPSKVPSPPAQPVASSSKPASRFSTFVQFVRSNVLPLPKVEDSPTWYAGHHDPITFYALRCHELVMRVEKPKANPNLNPTLNSNTRPLTQEENKFFLSLKTIMTQNNFSIPSLHDLHRERQRLNPAAASLPSKPSPIAQNTNRPSTAKNPKKAVDPNAPKRPVGRPRKDAALATTEPLPVAGNASSAVVAGDFPAAGGPVAPLWNPVGGPSAAHASESIGSAILRNDNQALITGEVPPIAGTEASMAGGGPSVNFGNPVTGIRTEIGSGTRPEPYTRETKTKKLGVGNETRSEPNFGAGVPATLGEALMRPGPVAGSSTVRGHAAGSRPIVGSNTPAADILRWTRERNLALLATAMSDRSRSTLPTPAAPLAKVVRPIKAPSSTPKQPKSITLDSNTPLAEIAKLVDSAQSTPRKIIHLSSPRTSIAGMRTDEAPTRVVVRTPATTPVGSVSGGKGISILKVASTPSLQAQKPLTSVPNIASASSQGQPDTPLATASVATIDTLSQVPPSVVAKSVTEMVPVTNDLDRNAQRIVDTIFPFTRVEAIRPFGEVAATPSLVDINEPLEAVEAPQIDVSRPLPEVEVMIEVQRPTLPRPPVDRLKVVLPIRRRRRAELIARGVYHAFRDDDSDSEQLVRRRRGPVALRPMKAVGFSKFAHLRHVRPRIPEEVPQRFLSRPGPAIIEPWRSLLEEKSLLKRMVRRPCCWKGCDAVLGSEDLLRRHVASRGHALQGKFMTGSFGNQALYKCHWGPCEGPCFLSQQELSQHLAAKHVSSNLNCPYEDCDLTFHNVSRLASHVMKQHDDPEDTLRPLADLSQPLAPPYAIPEQPLPLMARTEELMTVAIRGTVAGSEHKRGKVVEKVHEKCVAPPDPVLHVDHPPLLTDTLDDEDDDDDVSTNTSNAAELEELVTDDVELLRRIAGKKRKSLLKSLPRSTAMAAFVSQISVTKPPPTDEKSKAKGAHWANDKGTAFVNPWPSFKGTPVNVVHDKTLAGITERIPQIKADFTTSRPSSQLKATWLGHACFLVELPAEDGSKGVTVLFDPIFSQRCSPFTFMGPSRYTPPPCTIDDLPEVDIIVISHNHYDHEDLPSLRHLYKKHAWRPPVLFVPLNTKRTLTGVVPETSIHECDWWDEATIAVQGRGDVQITCTPCQHFTGRGVTDRNASLWASWALKTLPSGSQPQTSVWFGGDTGYCSVHHNDSHDIEPDLPTCPVFKEIGERLGPFTLGLIPIGAYAPRRFMSPIHNAPIDSVRMFQDVKCKQALGIHWGTFRLTSEPMDEPPKRLATARARVGLRDEEFTTCAIGETKVYDV
ncbi:N-acyl-phosphatidylethanolamine-hydrolyzing phospholipase D, partial [Tremellales sp. Uapishka_1]